jgi:hypothetical protein
MISAAKLAANRANAQRSTGPRTWSGKLRSAQNGQKSKGPRTPPGKLRAAQNAQRSTGPRTSAGKRRAAQNARRHGLTLAACCETVAEGEIAALGQAIAGASDRPDLIALATRIAAAQIDLARVGRARLALYSAGEHVDTRRLAALERYEQRMRVRRKLAIRDFDAAARLMPARPRSEPPQACQNEPKSSRGRPICQNEPNQTQPGGGVLLKRTKPNPIQAAVGAGLKPAPTPAIVVFDAVRASRAS